MLESTPPSRPSNRRRSPNRPSSTRSPQPVPLRSTEHRSGQAASRMGRRGGNGRGKDEFNLRTILTEDKTSSGRGRGGALSKTDRTPPPVRATGSSGAMVRSSAPRLPYGADAYLTPTPVKTLKAVPASPSEPRRRPAQSRSPRRPPSPLLYLFRLLILGVGVGAIAGTALSIWNPALRNRDSAQSGVAAQMGSQMAAVSGTSGDLQSNSLANSGALPLNQELSGLTANLQALLAENAGLTPGVFLVDLDTGNYLNLNGEMTLSAASMIKVPILIAFLQDVDAGKIQLDEKLVMTKEDVGGGSGRMQYQPVGTEHTALETATQMIITSDNTATNMIVRRLGGIETVNQRFQSWGMVATAMRNPLPDLEGTNTTTAKELVTLLSRVTQGDLISLRSRDRMRDIMQRTMTRTLLPSGLDEGARIAHKTGNISTIVGDTGIVDVPNGKRYIVAVIVQRPAADGRAQQLIRKMSRQIYQYFSAPAVSLDAGNGALPGTTPTLDGEQSPQITPGDDPAGRSSPDREPSSSRSPMEDETLDQNDAFGEDEDSLNTDSTSEDDVSEDTP